MTDFPDFEQHQQFLIVNIVNIVNVLILLMIMEVFFGPVWPGWRYSVGGIQQWPGFGPVG